MNNTEYVNILETDVPNALNYMCQNGQQDHEILALSGHGKFFLTTSGKGSRSMFRLDNNVSKYYSPNTLVLYLARTPIGTEESRPSEPALEILLGKLITEIKSIPD